MNIIRLESDRLQDFINYCRKNRFEHDESFLSEKELEEFNIEENPTTIAVDEQNAVVGVASVMLIKRFRENRKARIRILHAEEASLLLYRQLVEPLLKELRDINSIYGFLPETRTESRDIFEKLGFEIERYAWELKIPSDKGQISVLPDGFRIEPLVVGRDEVHWSNIINAAFKNLAGHLPMTPDQVVVEKNSEGYLEEGKLVLWHENKAVGVVNIEKEAEEKEVIAFLGPIAILPEYQGKGLGRSLLRAGIDVGRRAGLENTVLTVNAENSKAADLYLSEGFQKVAVFICYTRNL